MRLSAFGALTRVKLGVEISLVGFQRDGCRVLFARFNVLRFGRYRYLRIYYSDYLNNKDHNDKMHTLNLAWKKRRDDLKALFEWVSDMLEPPPLTKHMHLHTSLSMSVWHGLFAPSLYAACHFSMRLPACLYRRPRTRMDAYPMLLMLQEMLKTVLSDKYEFHLQALEKVGITCICDVCLGHTSPVLLNPQPENIANGCGGGQH